MYWKQSRLLGLNWRPSGSVFAGHQQEIHPLKPHHIVPLTAHLRGELPDVLWVSSFDPTLSIDSFQLIT